MERTFRMTANVWVAHASRVLVSASRQNRLFCVDNREEKFAIARRHRQTRETRALPKTRAVSGRAFMLITTQ
jgi:hypothetical protein